MANIGVGETFKAWLIKREKVTTVDSMIKDTEIEEIVRVVALKSFKYRHLSQKEMTIQPLSNHLKGRFDKVIFTSDTLIMPKERDKVLFEDGTMLTITRKIPQTQLYCYAFSKKFPHILELE